MKKIFLLFVFIAFAVTGDAQKNTAPKPLYDDPVYHGAADPVIIYNTADFQILQLMAAQPQYLTCHWIIRSN